MITTPLTLQQASELCRDYQNLVGRIFEKDALGKGYIECIAVAPYEESKQWLFAQYYKECKDPKRSLQFYNGPHYEVIALSVPILRKRGILFRDLRGYLLEHDIPFYKNRYDGRTINFSKPSPARV
jgi:hypothetical protein